MLVPPEGSSAVLVMIRSMSVSSATVLTLDEPIVVKLRFLSGVPLFYALFRGESPHTGAANYLARK